MRTLFLIAVIVIFFSCSETTIKLQKKETETCDSLNFAVFKNMLNKNLNALPSHNCYVQRDTILEGDEGVSWNGRAFYFKGKISFIAEADWEDIKTVKRITILSPLIKDDGIYIGQTFKEIKYAVKDEIPTSPEGYLFLKYANNENVFIQIDISKEASNSSLFQGVNELNKIPDNLKVISIVVRNIKQE